MKKLIVTTALTALMSSGAFAQADANNTTIFSPAHNGVTIESQDGFFAAYEGQVLASFLMGKTVHTNESGEPKAIGDINDIVLSPDGRAQAIIIGIGGFLGIGEKEVAIDFSNVNWIERDDSMWLVTGATRAQLESAPEFERADVQMFGQDHTMNSTETKNPGDAMGATQEMTPSTRTGERPELSREEMDKLPTVASDTLSADELIGARVQASDGEDIGEIGDVLVSTDQSVTAYIIDVGGFLGVGEKPVAVSGTDLMIRKDANGWFYVTTPFSREQLEAQQPYTRDAFDADPTSVLVR